MNREIIRNPKPTHPAGSLLITNVSNFLVLILSLADPLPVTLMSLPPRTLKYKELGHIGFILGIGADNTLPEGDRF